ncbi:50S ribosomal protein L6 [Helicobacter vulpis]|uniref:50S ribosomal protein L6 n=1 Tax=Helicobacter vulpis TaxID=2316076 RepID=UPI000EB3BAD1|nr:50S ribosomal protein L6 [Helicobacter vulpis]
MSRIGKRVIKIPSGVQASLEGTCLHFKNNKATQSLETHGRVRVVLEGDSLRFEPVGTSAQSRAFWGTYNALANNIVVGLDKGFSKVLEINGVGYKAALGHKVLELTLGFSHPVKHPIPEGVEVAVDKNTIITLKGSDKQQIGQLAADIRAYRPPEPYKGKGIKYSDEVILRKAGKTAKK